jgi:hypothetical protein
MRSKFLPLKNRQRKIYFLYPMLPAGAVNLVGCLIGTLKKFKIKALGGLRKTHNKQNGKNNQSQI